MEKTMTFIGKKFLLRYESGLEVVADYKSSTEMTWKALTGPSKGTTGTETIYTAEVAPNIFFISWLEAGKGISVSNVVDFNNFRVTAFVTFDSPNERQAALDQGTITEI
jgi:phenolic acid decarboxylase